MEDLSITSTRKEENRTGKFNTFLTNAAFHQGTPKNQYPLALRKYIIRIRKDQRNLDCKTQ
jgi:hypothetical protein